MSDRVTTGASPNVTPPRNMMHSSSTPSLHTSSNGSSDSPMGRPSALHPTARKRLSTTGDDSSDGIGSSDQDANLQVHCDVDNTHHYQ